MVFLVLYRHMLSHGGKAIAVTSYMAGNPPVLEEQLNGVSTGMEFQLLSDKLMGNRVEVTVKLDMIINIDLHRFDVGIVVSMLWQWFQSGFINIFKPLLPVALKLFKGLIVNFFQQCLNALIEFV